MDHNTKRLSGHAFTVSGKNGNLGSNLFVKISIPGGTNLKVLDRHAFDGAVAAANNSLKKMTIGKAKWRAHLKDD